MKLLFSSGPQLGLRLITFALLSIALMVFDYRLHYLVPVRNALIDLITPVQYFVDAPIKLMAVANANLASRQALLADNATLRAKQLLLQAELQKLIALESENTELRALLASSNRNKNDRITVAQLLAVNTDPLVSEVVLNKGERDGVYVGQPVLDANGIMGQVSQIGSFTSRVLLLSDPRSAIPVQNVRNGVRGIVAGRGNLEKLLLTDIPVTVDIKLGDLLISSGLGGYFPAGYPVGVVSRIRHDQSDQFAVIEVVPSAQLDRNKPVLLIWPTDLPVIDLPKPVEHSNEHVPAKPHRPNNHNRKS